MAEKKMIAESDRLILRRYVQEDLSDLFAYLSDPEVVAFEPYPPMDPEETRKNLEWRIQTEEMIAAELKSTHRMIGNIYLGKREFDSLELGFVFHQNYWGKGYAQEGCACLITQAFDSGIHRIFAECDPRNTRSWKLLERLDFTREAHLKQNVYFQKDSEGRPIWKDTYIYSRLHP